MWRLSACTGEVYSNRRVLSPCWLELIEEGNRDGSIHTQYAKELAELIPLLEIWLIPSIYPASGEETQHKFQFIKEMLDSMGLPLFDDEIIDMMEKGFSEIEETE